MYAIAGIVLIAAGILLVRLVMPKNGVPRMRSGSFTEMIYLMLCTGCLVLGIGLVFRSFA